MSKDGKDDIEFLGEVKRHSPFDPKNFGINSDPTKDRRWVDPKKIDERKYGAGYEFVKPPADQPQTADRRVRTKGGMVLMERPMEKAVQSQKRKEAVTRSRTQSAKNMFRDRVEQMSSETGRNLHKITFGDEG
jgi:hypothetical protein